MNLDIRMPIGLMFLAIGALLTLYGLLTGNNGEIYARSLGININLWWGMFMILFGAAMFFAARNASARQQKAGAQPTDQSPEGILTEERERQLGLESKE